MSGFAKLVRNWALLTPPLRPNHEVVAAIERLIERDRGPALLLGITVEFAGLVDDLVAVDNNPAMVSALWPGDTASRRAVVGDWRRLEFAPQSFSVCLADGSLSLMRFPDEVTVLLAEIARVLRVGAKVVFRVFACPENAETAALKDAALARRIESFHTYKWRLGMALAANDRDFNVSLRAILDAFNEMFPDRDKLVRSTGWSREQIDAIDQYADAGMSLSFPPCGLLAEVASKTFSDIRFVTSGTYELAERCPLLVMERR
jgi:SAM-dependent methyltransferase